MTIPPNTQDATAAPLGVKRSSGSLVRLPVIVTGMSPWAIRGASYRSGRMTLVRSTDSFRFSWRSSSITDAGSALRSITA